MSWLLRFIKKTTASLMTIPKASLTLTEGNLIVGGAATLTGTKIWVGNGTPTVTATIPARIGDIYVDYAAGKLYVASGVSAASDFKIVTSA